MITHLISTTEFVKLVTQKYYTKGDDEHYKALSLLNNYANFISQKPTLGMFVPCDKEGNILEEPKDIGQATIDLQFERMAYYDLLKQAQSKVLFKGWEIRENNCIGLINWVDRISLSHYSTLENLPEQYKKHLELTETTLKQVGLWKI